MIVGIVAGIVAAWAGVAAHDRGVAAAAARAIAVAGALALLVAAALGNAGPPAAGAALGALAVLAAVDRRTTLVYDGSIAAAYAVVLAARCAAPPSLLPDATAGIALVAGFVTVGAVQRIARRAAFGAGGLAAGDVAVLPLVPLAIGAADGFVAVLLALLAALVERVAARRAIPFLPYLAGGTAASLGVAATGLLR